MRQRDITDLALAYGLLADKNLVWSEDFELIRIPLALLLRNEQQKEEIDLLLLEIARKLIAEENWG